MVSPPHLGTGRLNKNYVKHIAERDRLNAKLEIIGSKLGLNRKKFILFCVRDYCLRNKHIIPKEEDVDKYMQAHARNKTAILPPETENNTGDAQDDI